MGIKQELDNDILLKRIKNLISTGLDQDTILNILGLTREEYEELIKNI